MNWICSACTTAYSVGAPACPQCGSADCYEQGDESMAKITRHGGPSNAAAVVAVVVAAAASGREESGPVIEVPDEVAEFVAESDVPIAPGEPYDTWLRADLEDECRERGLPTSGNKPELVQRLIDDDAQTGGPEEAEPVDDEVQPVF